MSFVTYTNESPAGIRWGDIVETKDFRTIYATSDAELCLGDYVVRGYLSNSPEEKYFTFSPDELVSISYEEEDAIAYS